MTVTDCEDCKEIEEYILSLPPIKCSARTSIGLEAPASYEETENFTDAWIIWANHYATHNKNMKSMFEP